MAPLENGRYGPRGPQHLIVLFLMAVAMLFILLRTRQPAYADPLYDKVYPKPKARNPLPCSPPLGGKPFLLTFWSFLFWGVAFVLGVLWPAGARFPLGAARGSLLEGRKPLWRSSTKVGIYGLALNPKRWKFGWPPAKQQVGGKICWPSSWAQPLQGYTYHHPHLAHAATLTPFRCVGGAIHA